MIYPIDQTTEHKDRGYDSTEETKQISLDAEGSRLEIECSSCEDIESKFKNGICDTYHCPKYLMMTQ